MYLEFGLTFDFTHAEALFAKSLRLLLNDFGEFETNVSWLTGSLVKAAQKVELAGKCVFVRGREK